MGVGATQCPSRSSGCFGWYARWESHSSTFDDGKATSWLPIPLSSFSSAGDEPLQSEGAAMNELEYTHDAPLIVRSPSCRSSNSAGSVTSEVRIPGDTHTG